MADVSTAGRVAPAGSHPAIEIKGMHKWYGEFHVLRNINLSVAQGEKIVICGPSGSGKSTLIRCINRLEEHQKGDILVEGAPLTSDLRQIDKIRAEVGMVFQSFNLFPHLTIMDNLCLAPVWVKKMPRAEAERLAEAVGTLERRGHESGAGDRRDQRVELGHHRVAGGGGEAVRRNEAVPCEVAAKGEEGVGFAGGQQRRDALHQLHGVAPVGLGGVGATPCERLRDVDGCTTHDALPTRHERPIHHHRQPAATRSLNSVIMSSHTGSRRRRPCQNDWCRRASNSSKGVPCCSTHV